MISDVENRNNALGDQVQRLKVFQQFINSLPDSVFNRSIGRDTDDSFGDDFMDFNESGETSTGSLFSRESNSSFLAVSSAAEMKQSEQNLTSNNEPNMGCLLTHFVTNTLSTAVSLSLTSALSSSDPTYPSKFFLL